MKKTHLFLCAFIIFLGAVVPVVAMSDDSMNAAAWVKQIMQRGRKSTSKEVTDFVGRPNLAMVNVSGCGELPEALQTGYIGEFRGHEALFWAPQMGSDLAIFVDNAAMAALTPTPAKVIVVDIGFRFQKKERHAVEQIAPFMSGSGSKDRDLVGEGDDSDSEDSDSPRKAVDSATQYFPQASPLTKNCYWRLLAYLNRMWPATAQSKNRGPAPTLGSMLDKLWD